MQHQNFFFIGAHGLELSVPSNSTLTRMPIFTGIGSQSRSFCGIDSATFLKSYDEDSEQARAPHTNGPRGVPRCGALSLLQKTLHKRVDDGGAHAISRGGARCASQLLHRCAQAVSRGAARCASQVLHRGTQAVARGAATLSQQEKNNSAGRVNITSFI